MTTQQPHSYLADMIGWETGPPFLGAPQVRCTADAIREANARFAVLGLPYDQGSFLRSRATAHGPKALREEAGSLFSWFFDFDVDIVADGRLVDVGDATIVPGNAVKSFANITQSVEAILDADAIPVCLGGDHSVPIPVMAAYASRRAHLKLGYLHLDSHMDAQPDVDGEKNTSWQGVARATEHPCVDGRNVAVLGIHGAWNSPEELAHLRRQGSSIFTMRQIDREGIDAVVDHALDVVTDGTDGFYVTWDVDVVDVAAMPGADAPEPGGLTSREALRAAERIGARQPVGIDLVEFTPAFDTASGPSAKLSVHILLYLLASYIAADR
jgi:agmatinase